MYEDQKILYDNRAILAEYFIIEQSKVTLLLFKIFIYLERVEANAVKRIRLSMQLSHIACLFSYSDDCELLKSVSV